MHLRFRQITALYFNWEYPLDARMYFQLLQRRLVESLRRSIGNGLMTERGLARRAGISQPHMHHILKGVRALSPQVADRILRAFELTVMDLLELAEMDSRAGAARLPGVTTERLQAQVGEARARRERAGLLTAPGRAPIAASADGAWPLPGRFLEPDAPPTPN
jgi:plasmid maintenance system antidote protein VapI